jgi:phage/plasmid-associated DNA primase
MGRTTSSVIVKEIYSNKKDIDTLLKTDTEHKDYPSDYEKLMDTVEQNKLAKLIKGCTYSLGKDQYSRNVEFKKKTYNDVSLGRLYPHDKTPSIQTKWKQIRNVLFHNKVIGMDMVNSQPTALLQLCVKHFPNEKFENLEKLATNRDQVFVDLGKSHKNLTKKQMKTMCVSILFGQGLDAVKKKYCLKKKDKFIDGLIEETNRIKTDMVHKFPNGREALEAFEYAENKKDWSTKENFALAIVLQNFEGDVALLASKFLKNNYPQVEITTIIHDEICVLANDFVINNIKDIMCKIQEYVKANLEMDIKLDDTLYTKEEGFIERHASSVPFGGKTEPDDVHNGKILFNLLKDSVCKSKETGKFMYDETLGIWVSDEEEFKGIVYKYQSKFQQRSVDDRGRVNKHFNRDIGSLYTNIMSQFWALVKTTKPLNSDNNRGFLLFNNGVLDCFNMKMLEFSPNYHFTKSINRDFDIEKDYSKEMENVKDQIFMTAYTTGNGDTTKLDYFMEILSIALMEGGVDKKYLTMLGETNSGKGVLTSLLKHSFGGFVSTFNTSVLMVGNNANLEDASKWRWLTKCYDSRLMIGNEVAIQSDDSTDSTGKRKNTERGMNIDMIKSLVSGGDAIEARRMRENEITITPKAFLMILANDMPKTSGDKAFANRTLIMNSERSSTVEENYNSELFFSSDPDIKQWIQTDDACDGFVALICSIYAKVKNNRSTTPDWVTQTVSEYVSSVDPYQWINENYDVYDGDMENDFDAVKSGAYYTVNWGKVGSCKVPAKDMFDKYRDGGGKDSSTKFGKTLTIRGILNCKKNVGGKPITYRVGVSLLANKDEDEDDN